MERITYRITLDAHKSGIQRMLQGFETADNMTRRIDVSLVAGGETYELPENTAALIYITLPDASEPIINDCTIRDNTVVYDVLPITTEGITEMQIKLIEVSMEGARRVLVSPRFAVEVSESGTSDEGAEQITQFTSLENAIAQAKAVYDSRIIGIDIGEDCTFRVYYADETVYENSNLHKALYKGNALLSESWAKGETGIREGEDINNSKYFSDVSRSAAKDASMVYDDANRILNEAIKHTAFTSFLVDFENGNLEYMSQNSTFNVNETNGDLEFELSNDYDPEKIIGEVVDEYIERKSTEINEKLENADAKTFGGKEPSYFATAADVKNANGKIDEIKNSILDTMEEIEANTQADQLAGASAVKELSEDVKNIDGSQSVHTSILEKALTLEKGVYQFTLAGGAYTGNDLPSAFYAYGNATIYKRTAGTIMVEMHGAVDDSSHFVPVFNYYDGTAWSGWKIMATTDDLSNYLPISGGTLSGNLQGKDGGAFATNGNILMKVGDWTDWLSNILTNINNDIVSRQGVSVFVQKPSDWLGNGFSFTQVSQSSGADLTYAPPRSEDGKGLAWWNVITFGAINRCVQIAIYGYGTPIAKESIFIRRQHDNRVSNWNRIITSADIYVQNNKLVIDWL